MSAGHADGLQWNANHHIIIFIDGDNIDILCMSTVPETPVLVDSMTWNASAPALLATGCSQRLFQVCSLAQDTHNHSKVLYPDPSGRAAASPLDGLDFEVRADEREHHAFEVLRRHADTFNAARPRPGNRQAQSFLRHRAHILRHAH